MECLNKTSTIKQVHKKKGVKPDIIVGLMLERSIEMIIGIFGILKAGAAYLPIDPNYPEERIRYMLLDSKVSILVKDSNGISDLKGGQEFFVLNFEHLNFEFVSNFDIRISDFNASNLAYVIYTSGTTGNPKGVMIMHHSLVNRLNWMQKKYPIDETDTILHKTPLTFDVSVWEIFWWAITGAKVSLLVPGGEKEPGTIEDIPENSHMKFDMMISLNTAFPAAHSDWIFSTVYTHLLLTPGADAKALAAKFPEFIKKYILKDVPRAANWKLRLQPLRDIYLYSDLSYDTENGNGKTVYFLLIIAFLVLVISWINYVNKCWAATASN